MTFRQLCILLDPEVLLRTFSELLIDFDDVVYKRRIVDMLNTIVMTTSELHSLRIRLKDMKTEVRHFCGMGVPGLLVTSYFFPHSSNRGISSRVSTRVGA